MPPLQNWGYRIKRKHCSAADEILNINCLLFMMYLWINISHLFVCLLTLKLPTFEQRVSSTKMHYRYGQTATKKGDIVAFNSAHRAKKAIQISQLLVWTKTERCTYCQILILCYILNKTFFFVSFQLIVQYRYLVGVFIYIHLNQFSCIL